MTQTKDDTEAPALPGPAPEGAGPGAKGPAAPEAPAAEAQPPEARGLEGVDAQPLPPLTREEVEAMRRERDELRDQLLRRRAEFENYRKRVERDRHQARVETTAALLRLLIPTLDNIERALKADASEASLREGVELIQRELVSALEGQGVVSHDPTGQKFDPKLHQALAHEAVPGFADGTIVEVYRKGYFFKDQLLRPALVKVAKGVEEAGDGKDTEAVH